MPRQRPEAQRPGRADSGPHHALARDSAGGLAAAIAARRNSVLPQCVGAVDELVDGTQNGPPPDPGVGDGGQQRFQARNLSNDQLTARIGRSRFGHIRAAVQPQGRNLRIGAHNREYAEAYWFGNPGNYQWFVVSHNDAGIGAFDFSIDRQRPGQVREGVLRIGDPQVELPPFDPDAPYARHFRDGTTINTLTVLGPLQRPAGLIEPRGPDSNQVRVLMSHARQRRRIRRRVRRVMRKADREARRQQDAEGSQATA